MNTKVIIENGKVNIELTPENEFEKDILKKVYGNNSWVKNVDVINKGSFHYEEKYRLNIILEKNNE